MDQLTQCQACQLVKHHKTMSGTTCKRNRPAMAERQ